MKLLILEWGAYTQPDINDTLLACQVSFRSLSYCFGNKNEDDFFCRHFRKYLKEDDYDAVFSINYFPLIAEVCHEENKKYISWSYDNPLNVPRMEETLAYDTNYVFLFDRNQAAFYQKSGYNQVYHLPLAVNPDRLSKIVLSPKEYADYHCDISFVGKLYESPLPSLLAPLNDYCRGYLEALAASQLKIYGYYFIDDFLTPAFMDDINRQYQDRLPGQNFSVSKEQLSYAIASYVTRRERISLLMHLSSAHRVSLYSREIPAELTAVTFKGSAQYMTEMPKIFHASRINLNITLKISQTGVPLRVMDILGCGGFLLSNYQAELAEYFIPDEEIVLYSDAEDALEKADFYLSHEDLRRQIAVNGQRKVFQNFNYRVQLEKIFRIAGLF